MHDGLRRRLSNDRRRLDDSLRLDGDLTRFSDDLGRSNGDLRNRFDNDLRRLTNTSRRLSDDLRRPRNDLRRLSNDLRMRFDSNVGCVGEPGRACGKLNGSHSSGTPVYGCRGLGWFKCHLLGFRWPGHRFFRCRGRIGWLRRLNGLGFGWRSLGLVVRLFEHEQATPRSSLVCDEPS